MASFNDTLDNKPEFTENGPAVTLDNNATLTGVASYDGAVLTLARDGGASPDDVFGARAHGTLSFSDGQVLLQQVAGSPPDQTTFDVPVGTYSSTDGTLAITFNTNADPGRVDAVLDQLTYANGSNAPPLEVVIDYTFDDGEGRALGSVTVKITPADDPPTLDNVAPVAVYQPGSSPIVLSPDVAVGDVDSPTLASATVKITPVTVEGGTSGAGLAGDVLSAAGTAKISVSYNASTFTLTLFGTATLDEYRQVLDTVSYSSSAADPSNGGANGTRHVAWQVDDGSGGTSRLQATTVHFPPTLDLDQSGPGTGFSGAYTENGAPVPIADTDATIFTPNATSIGGATVILTNAQDGDLLSTSGALPNDIAQSVDMSTPGKITLTLSGQGSTSAYQTALHQVVFSSTSDNPDPSPRDIAVSITDNVETSNVAHTSISVAPMNDAPLAQNTSTSGDEDTPIVGNAVATDVDNTGDQLTYALAGPNGGAQHGTVSLNADGSFSYAPNANYNGADSFSFKANDGALDSNVGVVTIAVDAVDDAPVLTGIGPAHAASTEQVFARLDSGAAVSDLELDALNGAAGDYQGAYFYVLRATGPFASPTSEDTFSFDTAGASFTVVPTGTDTGDLKAGGLTFAQFDGSGGTASVNFTSSGTPATSALVNDVLARLTYANQSDTPPASITLAYTFADGNAGAQGSGSGGTTEFLSVDVAPVNDAPVAQNGSASGNEDSPVQGNATATDIDSSQAQLSFSLVGTNGGAQHGTVAMSASGGFTYTPAHDFNGTDSFSFKANDGGADSNVATISLTVNPINDAPVAQNGAASGNEDTAIVGAAHATDVDTDQAQFSYALAGANGGAQHGTVALGANGSFTYTPAHDFNGTDAFSFRANDGSATGSAASVTLTVNPVNDAPVAQNGSASGNEDTPISGTVHATDIDNTQAQLSFALVGANGGAQHGTVSLSGGGSFVYTPAPNYNGPDSFAFLASDGVAQSNVASISVIVDPVSDGLSPIVLNDLDWAHDWNHLGTFRQLTDLDHSGTTDYVGFGDDYSFVASGGTWSDGQGHVGPGFADYMIILHDFSIAQGYTLAMQRGATATGAGIAETVYGQGFAGVYWYAATAATAHQDAAGKTYETLTYDASPHLYAQFGLAQGWTEHNGFDVVKAGTSDVFASILGFGNDGVMVGPQAFAPGANASQSYLIPLAVGNHAGWDQTVDVRTFQDDRGGAIDLNHDGVTDFVGMGPDGLVFAFGNEDGSGHYGLGALQTAHIHGTNSDLGRAQGWTDANTVREVVHDAATGFNDIIAFGNAGVYVAMGQDPATHGGQPFGQMYLALDNFGADQGWTTDKTVRLVGDVNGDGTPDIVGFGLDNTFTAIGSRDASGNLHFAIDPAKTIADFGFNQAWDPHTTLRQLADVSGTGHDSLVLSGANGTHVWELA